MPNGLIDQFCVCHCRRYRVQANTDIAKYERGKNEPPATVLLLYSRVSGIPVDQIIDDELSLDLSLIRKPRL